MNNKKLGNRFEAEFCEILSDAGFWVHNMAQKAAGQPADVIAVRASKAHLIDCKVCSDNRFQLSRIESNQIYAMKMWKRCGNGDAYFALKMQDGMVVMITFTDMLRLMAVTTTLNEKTIMDNGISLERWTKL